MDFCYHGEREDEVNDCLRMAAQAFARHLGPSLVGLYLHGSLAMGSFRPWSSDIDLLAVVEALPAEVVKLALVQDIMALADGGETFRSFEFSVVTAQAAAAPHHPIPYVLHYSSGWHQAYKEDRAQLVLRGGEDADLAAHFTVTQARGAALLGAPIAQVFGPVPREDYLRAIWYDIASAAEGIHATPMYTTLNLCRTLCYCRTGFVGSKAEGGQWALAEQSLFGHREVIAAALKEYAGAPMHPYKPEELAAFSHDLLDMLEPFFSAIM